MTYKIEEIEGIGPMMAEKLGKASIKTVEQLLEAGATKSGRKKLAETVGIDEGKILSWVNKADLFRVKGIGQEFSDLLEAAGVDTVKELRTRNATNLLAKMQEVNEKKKLTRALPALKTVEGWIEFASTLDAKVTY
ncbi:MAG TPA: DUF4332 domain-containing protein [Prolixibacteraceae bacterium]|jgi:predicted flap endonuclease-1-like 5' DNA nuclease|nr:DUF4332 domain-containing protein [Prolixibacteraceae bacterium]